jgi:hypothetical protein
MEWFVGAIALNGFSPLILRGESAQSFAVITYNPNLLRAQTQCAATLEG